ENALPALKSVADYVTAGRAGEGVARFVHEHLLDDCRSLAPRIERHALTIGYDVTETERSITVPAHHQRILVSGQLAASRHALLDSLVGAILERDYQVLVIDTEGPLVEMAERVGMVIVRAQRGANGVEEIASVFSRPGNSALFEVSWLDGAERVTA